MKPHLESSIPGFYQMSLEEKRRTLVERLDLPLADQEALWGAGTLHLHQAEQMVENVIGLMSFPLGVATNFLINGRDFLIPMVTEEASVIAAASHAAKFLREGGGITSVASEPLMIGQIQILDVPDLAKAKDAVLTASAEILQTAASFDPRLIAVGGGPRSLEIRDLPPMSGDDPLGPMLIVHLLVDVRDAMGANAVNTMCEGLAPFLAALTGGRVRLRILSNLADRRTITVRGKVPFSAFCSKGQPLSFGEATALGIQEASVFAERDPYRAATHNKGIMNGIDAVLLATGQDIRAVEAGAHAYAAHQGRYTALSRWRVREGALHGEMVLPLAVGIVGGVIRVHPTAQSALRLLQIQSAAELAQVAASVGLAQNLAALRALSVEGIQRGHMRLHSRNVAVEAGASAEEIEPVVEEMSRQGRYSLDLARQILLSLRSSNPPSPEEA